MQELKEYGGFNFDFKESLGGQQCVARSESLTAAPERVICETVRVRQKLQWRPQECGARNVEPLWKKATGTKQPAGEKDDGGCN
jgi:hypothetical protein